MREHVRRVLSKVFQSRDLRKAQSDCRGGSGVFVGKGEPLPQIAAQGEAAPCKKDQILWKVRFDIIGAI